MHRQVYEMATTANSLALSRYAPCLAHHKDEKVNVTLFGFAAGEELSAHSAPTPAVLYFLEGEAELQLGTDKVQAGAGSFAYMPPMLSHGISAKTGLRMLLVQMKEQS